MRNSINHLSGLQKNKKIVKNSEFKKMSQEYDQDKQSLDFCKVDLNEKQKADQENPYETQYQMFMKDVLAPMSLDYYEPSFRKHNINYDKNKFCAEPNFIFLSETENFQVLTLGISFSYFAFQINVLNVNEKSNIEKQLITIGSGAMGKILHLSFFPQQKIVIKSINYNKFQQFRSESMKEKCLREAILECCLNKLFSSLQIGPEFKSPFGFDIIIFDDTVQFAIQMCEKVKPQVFLDSIPQLTASLKIIHSFHLVHGDIKPQNIMWSPSYNKLVFIDFGLCKIVKEQIGQLTHTSFFGSYEFTLPEMKALLIQNTSGKIDLYFNDIYALNKIKKMKTRFLLYCNLGKVPKEIRPSSNYINQLLNYQLQFLIFSRSFQKVRSFILKNNHLLLIDSTLELLVGIYPSSGLKKITKFLFNQCKPIGAAFNKINQFIATKRLQPYVDPNTKSIFFKRIKQISKNQKATLNQIMIFLKLLFNQDLSPHAFLRKIQLLNAIKTQHQTFLTSKEKVPSSFWKNFIELVQNLYSTPDEINNIFQIAKDILSIKKWEIIQTHNLKVNVNLNIFFKAKQIAEQVFAKFNLKLFAIEINEFDSLQLQNIINNRTHITINYFQNSQKQEFKDGFHGKQLYDEFFGLLLSEKYQHCDFGQVIAQLQTKFNKSQNIGIICLLKFIKSQFREFDAVHRVQAREQILNWFNKYTITLKSAPIIKKMTTKFGGYVNSKEYEAVHHQFSNILKFSYNYCFNIDIMTFVILNWKLLLNLLHNRNKDSRKDLLNNTLNQISKYWHKIGSYPPLDRIMKTSSYLVQISLIQKQSYDGKFKKKQQSSSIMQDVGQFLKTLIAWICKEFNNLFSGRVYVNFQTICRMIRFIKQVLNSAKKFKEKFKDIPELINLRLIMFKESMWEKIPLKLNNQIKYSIQHCKIQMERTFGQISQIQYCHKLMGIRMKDQPLKYDEQCSIYIDIVMNGAVLQQPIQPYLGEILQYFKRKGNFYHRVLNDLGLLFAASYHWSRMGKKGCEDCFSFLFELAESSQSVDNNYSNFSFYGLIRTAISYMIRSNNIVLVAQLFLVMIQEKYHILPHKRANNTHNIQLMLPVIQMFLVNCHLIKTNSIITKNIIGTNQRISKLFFKLIKYVYIWVQHSPSFFRSRLNIKYYHYLLKILDYQLIDTNILYFDKIDLSNKKQTSAEKKQKTLSLNVEKRSLYKRRKFRNPSHYVENELIDEISEKFFRKKETVKNRKAYEKIREKLQNFNNIKKQKVKTGNEVELVLFMRDYYQVSINQIF